MDRPASISKEQERSPTRARVIREYFLEKVASDVLLEFELIVLALAAGINDATTYPDYLVFASNQTGNTALLAVGALGLADASKLDLHNIGVSLSLFMLGGTMSGQIGHRIGRTRRIWLLTTNLFQAVLVLVSAALRKWVATDTAAPSRLIVIGVLAFASGAQVAMARTVDVPEITTAMVTSAYIDFLVDPKLLARHNRPRNRRLLFVLALLLGTFVGAAAYREVGPSFGLLLAGLSKIVVCALLFFNRAAAPKDKDWQDTMKEQNVQPLGEIGRRTEDK